jgi:hypothetical protein
MEAKPMSKKRPPIDAIVKITQFGGWFSRAKPHKDYVWARVVEHHYGDQPSYTLAYVKFFAATDNAWKMAGSDWGDEWPLDEGDEWKIVPPPKVPDYVWVQAAIRTLSQ